MRRNDRAIINEEARSLLESAEYGILSMAGPDGVPHGIPLNFSLAGDSIYFHCAPEGKKLVYLNANNSVWGQALLDYGFTDECDYAYTSVHFKGKILLIEDLNEKRHAMEVMVRQLSEKPEAKLATIKLEKLAKTTMGRIDISCMTGKKHQKQQP